MLDVPSNAVINCWSCAIGDVVSLSLAVTDPAAVPYGGTARIAGVEYEGVTYGLNWEFTTPDMALSGQPHSLWLEQTSPFSFSGRLSVYRDDSLTQLLYDEWLTGRGTATGFLYFTEDTGDTGGFAWFEYRYDFEPVPEPATCDPARDRAAGDVRLEAERASASRFSPSASLSRQWAPARHPAHAP